VREPPDPKLAAAIKQLRKERHLSQEDVAFDADLTTSALSRIERGLSDPTYTTVQRIAEALEVGVVELVAVAEGDGTASP
jgi:transcriptional regulator with XRE-family HTH domain